MARFSRSRVLLIVASLLTLYAVYEVLFTPLFYRLLGAEDFVTRENVPIIVEKLQLSSNGTVTMPTKAPNSIIPLTASEWELRLQYWNNAGNQDKTPKPLTGKFLTWLAWDAGLNNRYETR